MSIVIEPASYAITASSVNVASPVGSIGTRMFGGRMGTLDNSTLKTFHVAMEVAQDYDAVRLILSNTSGTSSDYIASAKISAWGDASDLNNSAGTWVSVNTEGNTAYATALASRNASNRVAYTVTDWTALSSVPRTDGGVNPLLGVRLYHVNSNASLPVYGNGSSDDYANWATRTDGLLWCARQQNGDQITTPSGFTSTTNTIQSPICGVQFLARGKVVTVMSFGDSITEGRGTYINEGFILPACQNITNKNGVAVSYANCGWSGLPSNGSTGFYQRAIDVLEGPIKPNILVIPNGSPNDYSTVTDAIVATERYGLEQVLQACADNGVVPLVWCVFPANSSIDTPAGAENYGSTDSVRVAWNAEVLTWRARGIAVADTSTVLNGNVNANGQIPMLAGSTTDGIHPNDTGNALNTPIFEAALRGLIA